MHFVKEVTTERPNLSPDQRIGEVFKFGELNLKIGEERYKEIKKGLVAMESMHLRDTELVNALIGGDSFGFLEPVLTTMHHGLVRFL